jgi:hypothetical protein
MKTCPMRVELFEGDRQAAIKRAVDHGNFVNARMKSCRTPNAATNIQSNALHYKLEALDRAVQDIKKKC